MTKKELFEKFYKAYGKYSVNDFLMKVISFALIDRDFFMDVIDGTIAGNYRIPDEIF